MRSNGVITIYFNILEIESSFKRKGVDKSRLIYHYLGPKEFTKGEEQGRSLA